MINRPSLRTLKGALLALAAAGTTAAAETERPRFVEPTVEHPPEPQVDASRPGRHVQVSFPSAASAGRARAQYWLTGAEPLQMTVQVALGPVELTEPVEVTAVLLIGGRQTPFTVDGKRRPQRSLAINLVPRQLVRHRLSIPGPRLSRGAHAASLVLWDQHGAEFPGHSFVILNDELTAPPALPVKMSPVSGGGQQPIELRPLQAEQAPTGDSPFFRLTGGGRLDLEAVLSAVEGPLLARLTGFVGDRQVPLGALGPAPLFSLPPGERGRVEMRLRQPSAGRGAQMLVLFLIPELDRSAEARQQAAPPRGFPQLVGRARR